MNIPKLTANSSSGAASLSTIPSRKIDTASTVDATEKLIHELKNSYKNIHFDFIDFTNKEQLKNYASSQQGMNHVVISKELLDKMSADPSLQTKVKDVLNSFSKYQSGALSEAYLTNKKLLGMGLVIDENGEVSKWTTTEELPEQKNPFKEIPAPPTSHSMNTTDKKKNPYSTPYKYSHSSRMMQLANAKSVSSVRGLIASSHSEIGKVKLKVSDPKEAAAIIRKIKVVIQKGNIKISRLHREERLFQAERRAAKKHKEMEERQLAEELRKKKIARKAQEHCQTASFDDIWGKPSLNEERYRQISEQYTASMPPLPDSALSGVSMAMSSVAAPSTEVTISPVTTIDCSV